MAVCFVSYIRNKFTSTVIATVLFAQAASAGRHGIFGQKALSKQRHLEETRTTDSAAQPPMYELKFLDLSAPSSVPSIDGADPYDENDIEKGEYQGFTKIDMYNGGKNSDPATPKIAVAYFAYDCTDEVLCAAAYYNRFYLDSHGESVPIIDTPVGVNDDQSWIEFNGGMKLFNTGAGGCQGGCGPIENMAFEYIYTDGFEGAIGWEGCWKNVPETKLGTSVQLHFQRNTGGDGSTTSTGKDVNKGYLANMCGSCPTGPPPPQCTVEVCVANNPAPGDCHKWDCVNDACQQVPDNTQEGQTCGDNSNPCTNSMCLATGVCDTQNKADETACTSEGGAEGQCCTGTCQTDSCSSECPTTCPLTFSSASASAAGIALPVNGGATTAQCDYPELLDDLNVRDCLGNTIFSSSFDLTDISPIGDSCASRTYIYNYDAPSQCASAGTYSFQINAEDITPPNFDGPLEDLQRQCGITEGDSYPVPSATDTCDAEVEVGEQPNVVVGEGDYCSGLTKTLTWTAEDQCGNTKTAVQTVVVKDTREPTITVENKEFECGAAIDLGTPDANDDCSSVTIIGPTESDPTGDVCSETGEVRTYSYTATDECGLTNTAEQTVTVKDTQPPHITAPANVVHECGTSWALGTPVYGDQCTPDDAVAVTLDVIKVEGSKCNEVTTYSHTAEDSCGRTASDLQTVTLVDSTPPTFSHVPPTKNLQCTNTCLDPSCTGEATAGDICTSVQPITHCDEEEEHPDFPGIRITRTFTAEDECANDVSATQVINVVDSCEFNVIDAFSGDDINMLVNVVNIAGGLEVTVAVDDSSKVGDIRGVFFDLTYSDLTQIDVPLIDPATGFECDAGGVERLANGVLMKGGSNIDKFYNCGVIFGTPGKKKDDYQSVTFTILGTELSTDNLADASSFGVRLTSVGPPGARENSSKVNGGVTCCRKEPDTTKVCDSPAPVPEPEPEPEPSTPSWECVDTTGAAATIELGECASDPVCGAARRRNFLRA